MKCCSGNPLFTTGLRGLLGSHNTGKYADTAFFDMGGKYVGLVKPESVIHCPGIAPLVSFSLSSVVLIHAATLVRQINSDKAEIPCSPGYFRLTLREITVVQKLLKGYSPDFISKNTGLSIKTISHYKRTALAKLGIPTLPVLAMVLEKWEQYISLV